MAKLFNRAKMTTSTTGTGTITLGSAFNGFQSFADAGVADGDVVQYVIEEGSNFEIGTGTYTSSGTTLSRTPSESSNSDNAITLAGNATVSITAVAADMNRLQHNGSDKVTVSSTGASVTGNLAVSGTVDGVDIASRDGVLTTTKTTADAALPKAGGTMTGTITFASGQQFDGRDVSADGDKLDNIESNATADQTAAEIRAKVEAASDSNVFTDADHTKLNNIEAGAEVNDPAFKTIAVSGQSSVVADADADTLNLAAGSNVTITTDASTDTVTIASTDTDTVPNDATITISAGNALTGGGNFTTDQSSNETITINHADTSSQSSVNNSGRTYIQDITLDGYGHVTGISSATETVTDTNTNQLTTFQVEDGDGTEVTISHGKEWKFVEAGGININWTDTSNGSDTDPYDLSFNISSSITAGSGLTGGGQLNASRTISHADTSSQASVNNSGRTYIQDITLDGFGHVTGITSATETVTDTNTNQLTTFVVEDGDGTEVLISHGKEWKFVEGNDIDINWTDTSPGSDADPFDLTISHADTSSLSGTYGSTANGTKIDQITVDARGHVTSITTGPTGTGSGSMTSFQLEDGDGTEVSITNGKEVKFVEGGGIDINWTDTSNGTDGDPYDLTFTHADTSSQASVNNSGRTYIQDITLDGYGHVTGITSATETVTNTDTVPNNATITLSAGTNLSGGGAFTTDQSFNETITFNMSSTPSVTSVAIGSTVTLAESSDRADLLQITSSTSTWGGLQIRNSSNEGRWSFMTDGSTAGIYDDENGDWHMQMTENGGVTLYANGTANFTTGTTYMEMARHLDMNNYDIYGCDQIFHHGDTNTYMQFHNADEWRVVVGGSERLEVTGTAVLASTAFRATSNITAYYSDERLKTKVSDIANPLDKVMSLQGFYYVENDVAKSYGYDNEGKQVALSAQAVQAVMPEVVHPAPFDIDVDENGQEYSKSGENYLTIDYAKMVPLLVEAMKEQQGQIEELKAEIEALKNGSTN